MSANRVLFAYELARSSQICLIALAIRQRLVFETIWFLVGSNRCRPRSTTSKPGM
ncbi:hypothetical protein [Lapidilactobacillus wuchangensis]|uniref:hypothetical protein n=1 Tax=Lapidilactobacillus wuchangensis TaxID=2486001 RepID=UPI0013DE0BFE|nr:hypothetical protein [Lapidilactobacillus wuchangensis]